MSGIVRNCQENAGPLGALPKAGNFGPQRSTLRRRSRVWVPDGHLVEFVLDLVEEALFVPVVRSPIAALHESGEFPKFIQRRLGFSCHERSAVTFDDGRNALCNSGYGVLFRHARFVGNPSLIGFASVRCCVIILNWRVFPRFSE